jgi:phosphatidylserine decarboxylase
MKITPYGHSTFAKTFIAALILFGIGFIPGVPMWAELSLTLLALFLIIFALQFFRDPERKTPAQPNIVVSPADGKVVLIKDTTHPYFNGAAKMVCVFMSPVNVHVNRNPISGTVNHLKYIEGEYIAAFDHASGERNERTEIGIQGEKIKVLFKQISGFVARRIVYDLKENQPVVMGERFGMIKFGSRVDIFLPPNVTVKVKEGDIATAGETIVAEY